MKKIALLFVLSLFIVACNSNDDDGSNPQGANNFKKIKTITSENSVSTYHYNSNGFLGEIILNDEHVSKVKFVYSGNKILLSEIYTVFSPDPIVEKYFYEGNFIVKSEKEHSYIEYFYNDQKQLVKAIKTHPNSPAQNHELLYSYYQNGNLFSMTSSSGFYETYDYDDKINPHYYIYPDSYTKIARLYKNNLTRSGDFHQSYEYDSEGYPVVEYYPPSDKKSIYTYH